MVDALIAVSLALSLFIIAAAVLPQDRARLALASRVMSWLSLGAAIALPLAVVATYFAPRAMAPLNLRLYHLNPGNWLSEAVPLDDRVLALACAAVPLAVAVWGLLTLRHLFERFAAGDVFSPATGKTLRALSLSVFAAVISAFAAEGPISYFLLRANPAHGGSFALSIGLEDIAALFAATVVAVVARVMAEATRVADENASFV